MSQNLKKYRIGIRLEDKSFESRVPLIPSDIKDLLDMQGDRIEILVQESRKDRVEKKEKKKLLKFVQDNFIEYEIEKIVTEVPRCFDDNSYKQAGAKVVNKNNLDCQVIIGIKEIPINEIEKDKTYLFFSHIYKGQEWNYKMFEKLKDNNCTLIDYEMILANLSHDDYEIARQEQRNQKIKTPFEARRKYRTVFFGKHAGIVGAINSLWVLGKRLNEDKEIKTPFLKIKQSISYYEKEKKYSSNDQSKDYKQVNAYNSVKKTLEVIAKEIKKGLPVNCPPIVIGITGKSTEKSSNGFDKYGRSATGAKEVIDILKPIVISPEKLLEENFIFYKDRVYLVFFDKTHTTGENSDFKKYLPKLTILINCMIWNNSMKRIITVEHMKELYKEGNKDLIIGDVTCDPGGSIEMCLDVDSGNAFYLYEPSKDDSKNTAKYKPNQNGESGWQNESHRDFLYHTACCKANHTKGIGPVIMSVTNMPCELPGEASRKFSKMLWSYIDDISKIDGSVSFNKLKISEPIKRAIILYKGKLTRDFRYLEGLYKNVGISL